MRKKLPVLIALLTFSISVVLSYGWSSRKRIEDFLVETLSPEPQRDKFVGLLDACGPSFNFHQYLITTTGQTLEQTGESFDSEAAAHNALVRRLSQATKILRHTLVLDENKRQVGEKAVAVFPSKGLILERHGSVISAISAPTVELALEFEAQMERNDR